MTFFEFWIIYCFKFDDLNIDISKMLLYVGWFESITLSAYKRHYLNLFQPLFPKSQPYYYDPVLDDTEWANSSTIS